MKRRIRFLSHVRDVRTGLRHMRELLVSRVVPLPERRRLRYLEELDHPGLPAVRQELRRVRPDLLKKLDAEIAELQRLLE